MMSGNGNKVFPVLFKESTSKPKDRLKSSLISPLGSMLSGWYLPCSSKWYLTQFLNILLKPFQGWTFRMVKK